MTTHHPSLKHSLRKIIFGTDTAWGLRFDQFWLTSIDGHRGGVDVDANFSAGSGGTIRSFNPNITIYTV